MNIFFMFIFAGEGIGGGGGRLLILWEDSSHPYNYQEFRVSRIIGTLKELGPLIQRILTTSLQS